MSNRVSWPQWATDPHRWGLYRTFLCTPSCPVHRGRAEWGHILPIGTRTIWHALNPSGSAYNLTQVDLDRVRRWRLDHPHCREFRVILGMVGSREALYDTQLRFMHATEDVGYHGSTAHRVARLEELDPDGEEARQQQGWTPGLDLYKWITITEERCASNEEQLEVWERMRTRLDLMVAVHDVVPLL